MFLCLRFYVLFAHVFELLKYLDLVGFGGLVDVTLRIAFVSHSIDVLHYFGFTHVSDIFSDSTTLPLDATCWFDMSSSCFAAVCCGFETCALITNISNAVFLVLHRIVFHGAVYGLGIPLALGLEIDQNVFFLLLS